MAEPPQSRVPALLGWVAGLLTLALIGPIAAAVAVLRSSSDAVGPSPVVQLFIALFVLTLSTGAGLIVWAVARLFLRR